MKFMIGIKVLEFTSSGLVQVFEMETESIPKEDEKKLGEAFDQLTKMAMDGNSMFLTNDTGSIIIRGLDKKTIRFKAVYMESSVVDPEKAAGSLPGFPG